MTALTSPGQIVANIPGILGFYPHDSVILASFTALGENNRFVLGPVIRIDIPDLRLLPDLAPSLGHGEEDLIMAFVISDRPEDEIAEIVDALHEVDMRDIFPVHACWVIPQILTGEPVFLAFGPEPVPGEESWQDDVVAPVSRAQSMSALLAHGELPDLTREEALRHFDPGNPHFSPEECSQFTAFARRHAAELLRRQEDGPEECFDALAEDIGHLLAEIDDEELGTADLMRDEEILLTTASVLGNSTLRDLVIGEMLRRARPASHLLLAVARTCGGTVRHNALAVYALCAVELNLSMRATPALCAVLIEEPGHFLSRLLLDACQAGAFDTLLGAVREGSRMVRAGHGTRVA